MAAERVYALVTNDLNYDQRMQRICTSLQDCGYSVTLVGRELQNSRSLKIQGFKQERLRCFFNSGILFYLEFNIRLIIFLLSQKIDIIHAVDLDTLGAGTMIKVFKRCKLVFDAHEYFTEVPELEGKTIKKRIWSILGKTCSSHIDAAITVSSPLRKTLSAKYNLDFQLLRNFPYKTDVAISEKEIHQKEKILIYQGAVNEGRGIEEAIEMMTELDEYSLWIIGEGDILDRCKEIVSGLELTGKVRFFGYVSPDELKDFTAQARIGLNLLSGNSKNYQYSLANKFFDYIQASVPSITMDFDTYTSILDEYSVGVAIQDINSEELLSAIQKIESQYELFVENCRIASEEYIWEKEGKKLIEIYRKVEKE